MLIIINDLETYMNPYLRKKTRGMELAGKTALVCGSTQGIGWAAAQLMAERGATVILLARNEEKLAELCDQLQTPLDQEHSMLVADFSKPEELKTVIESFVNEGNAVDILVNNSGGPKGGPIIEAEEREFISAFNQHLICNHILVKALYPVMKKRGGGSIINVISTSVKQPLNNLGVSNTVRGAVANWSKTMANELGAHNIRVNNVLPGATNTGRLQSIAEAKSTKVDQSVEEIIGEMAGASPMQRIAEPNEVAEASAFLASDRASYINGINIPVDGGRTKSL